MKNTFKILLSVLFVTLTFNSYLFAQDRREEGNLVMEDIPEIPAAITDRIQQYQNTRSAGFEDWLPNDGGMLISTRFGNTAQLHTVAKPGASRNQITFFSEPVNNGSFSPSPDYNGFLFTKDIGGNEFTQIYWFDMETRNTTMLSDGESRNFGLSWSNEGDRFAFSSNRRNGKDWDIYVSNLASPKEADIKIKQGGGYWITSDWSPDDTKLLLIQYISSTRSNSFIYDLKTDELTQINDPKSEAVFQAINWNATGDKIYLRTDEGREFVTLATYAVADGQIEFITDDITWDIEEFALSEDRSKAAFVTNENGFSPLFIMETATNDYEKVPDLPVGQVYSLKFHPEKDVLAMVLNTTSSPGDIYSLDLETMEKQRWTTSEVGGLNTEQFPKPELIEYETFDKVKKDSRKIPAFVYKPTSGEGPFPVLISIHGGPEGQHVPYFSSFFSFLSNEMGIAVIAPNVRGSSGYGKSYLKLDNGYKREESVEDIGKLIDWIGEQEDFDKDRISVFGGSYGGYMVLASMFKFNDKLKCGVDIVGISNFVTFLENTEEYRRDLRRVEYGDERDPKMREFLESISPNNHVDKIKKPLFVIQGLNDPRVPASESEQMVKAMRENGGTVWYMLAKDEGHGFRKKENRDRMTEAVALFLQENLLK
jgi:dipeptidyl aminopeptidase/acylaminoacyl peptidase